jgi:hypothetical protein
VVGAVSYGGAGDGQPDGYRAFVVPATFTGDEPVGL